MIISLKHMPAPMRVYSNKMLRTTWAPARMRLPWPIQLGPMMLAHALVGVTQLHAPAVLAGLQRSTQ
jgi:hypothetical protein